MINQLASLVDHYDVDLLIPTVADELPMVAKASQLGQLSNAQVVISPLEAVEKCFDKLLTMRALREAGVSVPPFGVPSDFTSAYDVFEQLGGAIITKPRVARGGRGFAIHTSPEKFQLESYDDSYIIQAFAPGGVCRRPTRQRNRFHCCENPGGILRNRSPHCPLCRYR